MPLAIVQELLIHYADNLCIYNHYIYAVKQVEKRSPSSHRKSPVKSEWTVHSRHHFFRWNRPDRAVNLNDCTPKASFANFLTENGNGLPSGFGRSVKQKNAQVSWWAEGKGEGTRLGFFAGGLWSQKRHRLSNPLLLPGKRENIEDASIKCEYWGSNGVYQWKVTSEIQKYIKGDLKNGISICSLLQWLHPEFLPLLLMWPAIPTKQTTIATDT